MKAQINHTHRHSTANYIFFGITLSIFTLSIYFSFNQKTTDIYSNLSVNSVLDRQTQIATTIPVTEITPINLKDFLIETTEAPIIIENWMTDASWTSTPSVFDYINTEVTETSIPIEDWMLSTSSWNFITESQSVEATIPLESWMLNIEGWSTLNSAYLSDASIIENEIALESWMLNMNEWSIISNEINEVPIPLESWMISTESWPIVEVLNAHYEEKEIALQSWMLNMNEWEHTSTTLANN
nr:hypothetical protein [uncultured Carboxylicivirga sp.]